MDDLIRRSEAIEILENTDWYHQNRNKDMVIGANPDEHQAWYKADDVYNALESAPSALPEKGSWVYGVDTDTGERDLYAWTCSECGGKYPWQPKFCPNCGVKMNLVKAKTITDGETTYIQENDKQGWKGV